MNNKISPGITHKLCRQVRESDLASRIGSGLVNVFSTAMLVAGMEEAAVAAVQPYLEKGQTTVGVALDISHKAPTPPDMTVCFQATLKEISSGGHGLVFYIEAHDEKELISEGLHRRVIINQEEFEKTALAKMSG